MSRLRSWPWWCVVVAPACGCSAPAPPPPERPHPAETAPAASVAPAPEITLEKLPPLSRGGTWLCTWGQWAECKERCDKDNALSCARLGWLLQVGASDWSTDAKLAVDLPKAREAFQRSCDLGYARGCSALGAMLFEGKGGAKDEASATRLFERACGAGDAVACSNLGSVAELASNEERARFFYKRACDLGEPMACVEVGASEAENDLKGALRSFRRALHEAPAASPRAARLLTCPEGSVAVATLSVAGGLGGPTMYCASRDGKREGPYIEWASEEDAEEGPEHGVMSESGTYHEDKAEGHFKKWYEDGKLRSEGDYKNGLEEGAWRLQGHHGSAVETGSFVKGKREGPWVEEDHSRQEGSYKADKREGVWIEYLGGEKFRESTYANGLLEGTETRWWPSGQKCIDRYSRGLREGVSTCWHPNRRKMSESTWHENHMLESREWDERGRPQ